LEEIAMAVQTNVQPDVRRRTDELDREYVAVQTMPPVAARDRTADIVAGDMNAGGTLLARLEKSAQTLRHAAESVENRGVKLLLKVLAQERSNMVSELRQALGRVEVNPLEPSRKPIGRSFQQGLEEIQTGMTVQRQGRQTVTLNHLLAEEDSLLEAYSALASGGNRTPLGEMLETQRIQIAKFAQRLKAVGDGNEPIVARVFDSRSDGERAVKVLQESGLLDSQIDAAPISRLARPVMRASVIPASPVHTMAAGAAAGAMIGALVGAALAAFVWLAPAIVGWLNLGPWALFLFPALIGAVFGAVFGYFIGQSQREDDLMVTADGLINGEILVVAYPHLDQVAQAEEILQVYHARELNR